MLQQDGGLEIGGQKVAIEGEDNVNNQSQRALNQSEEDGVEMTAV